MDHRLGIVSAASPSSAENRSRMGRADLRREGEIISDKYRIGSFLGAGGMGSVYEAHHVVIGRRFAIKFLHPDLARQGPMMARFQREAESAGSLESENIAAVFDFGVSNDGAPYIVLEYLEGRDLGRLLTRGPMSVQRIVSIVIQACQGLATAHEHGLIHRDLKPENLFVCRRTDDSDLVKLLDFGIAKLHQRAGDRETGDRAAATLTGTTMGTPHYMAPEQARGAKNLDHRADLYAIGVILYEALSGQKPHPGDDYNAILYHILNYPARPLISLRYDLPATLCDVVHRAMAFEAADRYPTIGHLIHALIPFSNDLDRIKTFAIKPNLSHATGPASAAITQLARHPTGMSSVAEPLSPIRNSRRPFALAVTAAAVAITVGVYASYRSKQAALLAPRPAQPSVQKTGPDPKAANPPPVREPSSPPSPAAETSTMVRDSIRPIPVVPPKRRVVFGPSPGKTLKAPQPAGSPAPAGQSRGWFPIDRDNPYGR